jgi:predicted O-methyltransferase YrrM
MVLRRLRAVLRKVHGPRNEPPADLGALSEEDRMLIARVRERKLTYLSEQRLAALVTTCRAIEQRELPGLFLEAGCALGGSTILLASVKRRERVLQVYDVFGMIPPPTADDTPDVHERYRKIAEGRSSGIDGDRYYGYIDNLYDVVKANLVEFGIDEQRHAVSLIKGLVQDTLVLDAPVAFAHIDVDWYEPVKTCLERIYPRLVVGGSIVLDDYHYWGGCRKATDEYLQQLGGGCRLDDTARSLRIEKSGD